jgi:hypothetical protein
MSFLPLPKNFDQNEWFVIISLVFLILLLICLPKRFPTSITILIITFSMSLARVVDHLLAGPNINFYDVMDSGKYELFDILCYAPYAPFAYLFVYIYDKWNIKGVKTSLFILIVSLFGIGFEWLTTKPFIDFFKYHNWNIIYSFPIYLVVQPLTLVFLKFIKKAHKDSLQSNINSYNHK